MRKFRPLTPVRGIGLIRFSLFLLLLSSVCRLAFAEPKISQSGTPIMLNSKAQCGINNAKMVTLPKYHFNFLIYPGVQPLDLIGAWEVIATWKFLYPQQVEMQIVAEKKGPVACSNHITLFSHTDFSHAHPADFLVVPGGVGRLNAVHNKPLIQFIKQQAKHCQGIISICTGSFLLEEAGLLKHKKATTYWRAISQLARDKEIEICEERIVNHGKIWCSGGVSSGIDLAFALISAIAGDSIAGQVQLILEYFPEHKIYATKADVQRLPTYTTFGDKGEFSLPAYISKQLEACSKSR